MKKGRDGWLRCDIERSTLQSLQQRSDGKGLLNLCMFLVPLLATAALAIGALGTAWSIPLFWLYGSIYGFSISILHETHHSTPFRSRALNEVVHTTAGLMTFRNPVYDRIVHAQHHRKTSYPELDPELAHPTPIVVWKILADLFWLRAAIGLPVLLVRQVLGKLPTESRKHVPAKKLGRIRKMAAFMIAFYGALLLLSAVYETWLPLILTYLANIYGGFIPRLYALTQHLGLAESGNDFRLNSRTCLYNPIAAAWYWNMNYHIEHHMFPLVPFHALPDLHKEIADQMPVPNSSVADAWREILACIRMQRSVPAYTFAKQLPPGPSR